MIVVYCSKDNRRQVADQLDLTGQPHEFASPTSTGVNYNASKCIIAGNYPVIFKRYQGIMPIEVIELEEDD